MINVISFSEPFVFQCCLFAYVALVQVGTFLVHLKFVVLYFKGLLEVDEIDEYTFIILSTFVALLVRK